jgi:SAM-dependent methyltransferase
MLEIARQIAADRGTPSITFNRMDAEALELPESSFNVALCALGLMYMPDPLQALHEMHRVLMKHGRAAALVWGARRHCGWAEIFPITDRRVKSDVCPLFFQLGTHDALQQTFLKAGFANVMVERFHLSLHFHSAEDACAAAFAGGPVALAYHRFDDRVREEVHTEYLNTIEAFRNRKGYDIPGEFVIAIGDKTKDQGKIATGAAV